MKHYLYSVLIPLVYGALAYLVTSSLYLSIGVFVVFAIFLCLIASPLFIEEDVKNRKRHEAYRFVNNFVISLSVTNSPEKAFDAAIAGNSENGELNGILSRIPSLSVGEKIEYLSSYFLVSYYPMFVSVYRLFEEQGGDFMAIASPLLKEVTRNEEFANSLHKESQGKLFEYISLWFTSGLIVGFLRYGLRSFYSILSASRSYIIVAMLYFVVALISFIVFAILYTGEKPHLLKREITNEAK